MNFPTDRKENSDDKENVDFAAILTGREEVPLVDTLDTALATFQSTEDKENLKYSVKVTDTDKIKEVRIDIGKPVEKRPEVVAELFKSDTPSSEVLGNLCE